MKIRRRFFLLLLVALLMSATPILAMPSTQAADYDIPNGHFFSQTADGEGGFSIIDDGEARFWSEFQRLGGVQTVGYPISQRYKLKGFVTQAFQKLVLQWRPKEGVALPVNLFDELSKMGFDETLLQRRQTPLPFDSDFDPSDASWEEIVARRQGLLKANEAIRARYFSFSDPLTLFGLPTSPVEDMGNHFALRTQRAVFQQWKEKVPWAQKGEVTIANGGDIAKELGWLPKMMLEPEPAPSLVVTPRWQAPPLLVEWVEGPGFTSYEYAWSTIPKLVLYNDGRIITSAWKNSRREIHEAQLTPDEVCAFLTQFEQDGFFDFDPKTYERPPIADAGTTHLIVNAWRSQKLDLYALSILARNSDEFPVSPALVKTYERLEAYKLSNSHPYQPERIAVLLTPAFETEQALPAWPLTTPTLAFLASQDPSEERNWQQVLLTGQAAQDVYDLFDGKITQNYSEGDKSYQVTIRALLPLESSKVTGGWRGPDIFPTTPTTEMSCKNGQ